MPVGHIFAGGAAVSAALAAGKGGAIIKGVGLISAKVGFLSKGVATAKVGGVLKGGALGKAATAKAAVTKVAMGSNQAVSAVAFPPIPPPPPPMPPYFPHFPSLPIDVGSLGQAIAPPCPPVPSPAKIGIILLATNVASFFTGRAVGRKSNEDEDTKH